MGSGTANDFVFIIAPGAWHSATHYDQLRAALARLGYSSLAVQYATVGAEPPTKHMKDDAALVRSAIIAQIELGKRVVLVAHSYGGIVGSEAVQGLGWAQREAEGKQGGVIQLVYLTAFIVPKNAALRTMLGERHPPWQKVNGNYITVENPGEIFYHDLTVEDRTAAIKALRHMPVTAFSDETTFEPFTPGSGIECSYIFADQDRALEPSLQEKFACALPPDSWLGRINSSHSPFISFPNETAGLLETAGKFALTKAIRA